MAVWGPRGQPLTVRCDPSRAKTSFYGGLNLKTGQVGAQEVEHMTAEATASYLETLLDSYPHAHHAAVGSCALASGRENA